MKVTQLKQIFSLCFNVDVLLFLTTALVLGLCNSIFVIFSFLYVTETHDVSKSDMTYVIVVATASESIIFPFTTKAIKLLRGTELSIIVGLLGHGVRFLVMSYDISFGVFVALQTLSGLGFSLAFAALMEHCHTITPEPIRVTMNTIMTTLFFIVSNFIASVGGAKIYESYGGKMLFWGLAVLCGAWSLVIFLHYISKHLQERCRGERNDNNVDNQTTVVIANDNVV